MTNATTKDTTSQAAKPQPAVAVPAPVGATPAAGGSGIPGRIASLHSQAGNRAVAGLLSGGGLIQRACAGCASGGAMCDGCSEEEEVQRAPDGSGREAAGGLPQSVVGALAMGGGRALDPGTRAFMESRFGQGFGHVRYHADEPAARAADSIGAAAFTVGSSVWFGRGQYRPERPEGLRLLAHELTHTIQQRGRTPGAQPSLRVGSHHDPSESLADRAADAVMAGGALPRLAPSGAVIRRAPKVSPVADRPDQRIVDLDDGSRHRVTRVITWDKKTRREPSDKLDFGAKISKDRVWLQVDYCEGTKGVPRKTTVQVGANVPAAAAATLKDIILNGTDPREALKSAEIEPFVSVAVLKSKQFALDLQATIKVKPGEGEVTGGGIKGTLDTGKGTKITAEGSINKPPEGSGRSGPDVRGEIKIEIPLERPKKVECPFVRREEWEPTVTFFCEKYVAPSKKKVPKEFPVSKTTYLYFKYAKDDFELRSREPGGKLNPPNMAALKSAMAEDWTVSGISGHASPEGLMELNPPAGDFKGNADLSQRRADAAKKYLESICPPRLLVMREKPKPPCFAPELKPTGKGELYSGGVTPELKGKALARTAVEGFQAGKDTEGDPEAVHRTPELEKELEKRKASPEKQADLIYPLLRRAEITLSRTETRMVEVDVPDRWDPEQCSNAVLSAAGDDFAKSPFPKPPSKKP